MSCYCTRVHWTSNFLLGTRKTRTCLTGHPVHECTYSWNYAMRLYIIWDFNCSLHFNEGWLKDPSSHKKLNEIFNIFQWICIGKVLPVPYSRLVIVYEILKISWTVYLNRIYASSEIKQWKHKFMHANTNIQIQRSTIMVFFFK